MAKQLPPPTDLTGLSEEDRISLGERMYQLIMGQGGAGQQQPMRQQAMPLDQSPGLSRQGTAALSRLRQAPRRSIQNAARTLMSGPPGRQTSMQANMGRQQGRIPGAFTSLPTGNFSPFAQSVMQGRMGRQPMKAAPQRQMPRMQPSRRLPPPQAMNRFAPQVSPMMQTSPMMQGLYNPLGAGFMPQQAPLMAFNPYQGMM
mgnify:CR=1 FL=1